MGAAGGEPSAQKEKFAKRIFTVLTLRKILYALGFMGQGLMLSVIMFFQQTFLIEVAEISPSWVGTMLLVKQFWDGAVDPLIGGISDSLDTRWGRRRPICAIILLPMMLFWVLQWCSPGWVYENESGKVGYYLSMILLASLTMGVFYTPYQAVIPDFASTYNSRTRLLLGVKVLGTVGTGTGSFIWMHLVDLMPLDDGDAVDELAGMPYDYRSGYFFAAMVVGVPIFITAVIGMFAMIEVPKVKDMDEYGGDFTGSKKLAAVKKVLKRILGMATFLPFVLLLCLHVLAAIGMAFFAGNTVLYFKYVLDREEATSAALLVLQATLVVFMVIWMIVAIGTKLKVLVFGIGSILLIIGFTLMYFYDTDTPLFVVILNMVLTGMGASAAGLMTNAMLPDVLELHYKKTNERQEALFYGVFGFLETFSQGISSMIAGYSLEAAGYLNPAAQAAAGVTTQPDTVLTVMKVLVSFAPLATTLCCFPFAIAYFFVVERKYRQGRKLAALLGAEGSFSQSDEESPLFVD